MSDAAPAATSGRRLRALDAVSVERLHRATPKKVAALKTLGIATVLDLLTTYPRRYLDRTRKLDVVDLDVGDEVTILATVASVTTRTTRQGRSMVEATVTDASGALSVVFFNQPWRVKQLGEGTLALFFGKVGDYRGGRQMANPVVDVVALSPDDHVSDKMLRIVPIYPTSGKVRLTSFDLGELIDEALTRAGVFEDPLPEPIRSSLDLCDRTTAMVQIHRPASVEFQQAARRRLAFDELLRLQLALQLRRAVIDDEALGIVHERCRDVAQGSSTPGLARALLEQLPFPLTQAQDRVLREILGDLSSNQPMHRLLQGDVGSGKTVVALLALLAVIDGGYQGALMVPTEVLAEQHAQSLRSLCAGLTIPRSDGLYADQPFEVALLTSKTPASERRRLLSGLADGSVSLVVGTHALLSDGVSFARLGLAVIDEQHRFGVEQRAALRAKGRGADGSGRDPDLLVMTATPIPRTAAMVLFGDLDRSVIDVLPPGRTPIVTTWASTPLLEEAAWESVRRAIASGRQAYVVCPLVEASATLDVTAVTEEVERLAAQELAGLRLGLLHGQMRADERRIVMEAFRSGALDVLVATTVIEVGVDVPNATVMVIEDAARFGIAQLHQLRGRVGRGAHASQCFLLGDAPTTDATRRLRALEASTDGFELAEVDLDLRGEGTILGARQRGESDLALASLARDGDLIDAANVAAVALCRDFPFLVGLEGLADELRLLLDAEEADFLFKS